MTPLTKRLFHYILRLSLLLLFLYLFFRYIARLVAPFIVAFFISQILEKPVSYLRDKFSVPRRISSLICTVLFFIFLAFITKTIIFSGIEKVRDFLLSIPDFSVIAKNTYYALERIFSSIFKEHSLQMLNLIRKIILGGLTLPLQLRDKIISITTLAASKIPELFLFVITLILSTYFLSCDYPSIKEYITGRLPKKSLMYIDKINKNLWETLICYIKAIILLAIITFVELSIGLMLLKIKNAVAYSFIIALFDALPIFGSGFILIPWIIASLIKGAYTKAIGLATLYLIVVLSRNIFEARIIGAQIGMHPLISIVGIYVGLHLFGAYGIIMPPLIFFLYQLLRPHKSATAE